MKKYKKIMAVLLTLVMVLGMSITSTAAEVIEPVDKKAQVDQEDKATVTITNITNKTKLTYVQLVEPDQTTETGWRFCGASQSGDGPIAEIFKTAFKGEKDSISAQDAIKALINAARTEDVKNEDGVIVKTNSSSDFAAALDAIRNSNEIEEEDIPAESVDETTRSLPVTSAGIYAIEGTEDGYTYNNMAAFVGFNEVTDTDGNKTYPVLQNVTISAKKAEEKIGKTVKETTETDKGQDKVVAVGSIVTYTITTTVPNVSGTEVTEDGNKTFVFKISDKLYGADYYLDDSTGELEDAVTGKKVAAVKSVKMGSEELVASSYKWSYISSETDEDEKNYKTFTIDLSSLIDNKNTNAGKTITVTYTAVVTSADGAKNTAAKHSGGSETKSTPVNVYSGQITLTKYGEDNKNSEDNLTDNPKLGGAKFKIYVLVREGDNGIKKWAKFTQSDNTNEYVFNGWAENESVATEVETSSTESTLGTLVVKGLDLDTYYFKETEAPNGYHIDDSDVHAELELSDGQIEANRTISASTYKVDSKLSSLPSTGGIGTTIFTIGGCAIMIAAAFLFFASRRKKEEK